MPRVRVKNVIKTSIISAFTIATALIWKDVIIKVIDLIVPPGEELFYELITAILATILAILAIYIVFKTEAEAEDVLRKFKHKNQKVKSPNAELH